MKATIDRAAERAVLAHTHDMQALLGAGFARLRHADYWLLRVTERARAREWLARILAAGLVASVADLGSDRARSEVVTLAFTWRGLRRLGIRDAADSPFPTPFRDAMSSPTRRTLLRDGPVDDWEWGDLPWRGRRERQVDLLVGHLHDGSGLAPDHPLRPDRLPGSGVAIVRHVRACPSYIERVLPDGARLPSSEPFGFADGISQPVLAGMPPGSAQRAARQAAGDLFDDRVVAAGEFVLGHRNEYGEIAYCPDAVGWREATSPTRAGDRHGVPARFAANGSYLVARQIWQDVQACRRLDARYPSTGQSAGLLERMVGRRRDGRPLLDAPYPPSEIDAFRYRQHDAEGMQCPRGAHIRRANPRDSLGWSVASGVRIARLHRLLRRGRTYAGSERACEKAGAAPCDDVSHRQHCGAGLFFIALNADLDRQFEFVQQQWLGNETFSDLADEDDPLLGPGRQRAFSMAGSPVGRRVEGMEVLTRTFGGGYFFLPGIAALRFIAGLPCHR